MFVMSEHQIIVRRLKAVSIIEAVAIAFMLGLILYLLQFVRSSSTVTLTPSLSSAEHAVTLPNVTTSPSVSTMSPSTKSIVHPKRLLI
jgi:hypothetical protein